MAELLLRPEQTEDALPPGEVSVQAETPASQEPVKNEAPAVFGTEPMVKTPSAKQQTWGTVISIVIIVAMVVVGAFYAWSKRTAETQQYAPLEAQ